MLLKENQAHKNTPIAYLTKEQYDHSRDCFPGDTDMDYIARMLSNAMNRADISAQELSDISGIKRGLIIGTLKGSHIIKSIELLQLCEAMGAELRIVFPEDE